MLDDLSHLFSFASAYAGTYHACALGVGTWPASSGTSKRCQIIFRLGSASVSISSKNDKFSLGTSTQTLLSQPSLSHISVTLPIVVSDHDQCGGISSCN